MNTFWKLTVLGVMGLILLVTFFSPAILSIITGNWWFMLLFWISWIPTYGEAIIFALILGFKD